MEAEEITKLVDGVYRNILDKFNPGARQLIAAGKSYLKALHGAATASRLFNEALAKIAMNAQQSGTGDIGSALMSVVNVNKEIQDQQMNILKAFYVDLLVPLETNLEKDTKVVQHEQKKFLQQHKVRMESYQKAVSTMKKQRKKKATPENTEKELRSLQVLEDQKKKLDVFCDQSYKNAMTQERRRYGFVLERQCSIAKHWMAYHTTGKTIIDNNFENWQEIASSREIIPTAAYESNNNNNNNNINAMTSRRLERIKDADDNQSHNHGIGHGAQLKKSRSIDAPYGDMRTLHERENGNGIGIGNGSMPHYAQNSLPRAKSDFNLALVGAGSNKHSTYNIEEQPHSEHEERNHIMGHQQQQWGGGDQRPVVKALYAYMPSGDNQLPFEEGDRIALVGGKAKGWQFGENLRTQHFGWFPVAYTNAENSNESSKKLHQHERYENMHYERNERSANGSGGTAGSNGSGGVGIRGYHDSYMSEAQLELESDSTYRRRNHSAEESSPTRMFGDTIKQQKKYRGSSGGMAAGQPRPGPPPTLPAPVPVPLPLPMPMTNGQSMSRMLNSSQSFCATNGVPAAVERRKQKLINGVQGSASHLNNAKSKSSASAAAKTSLHSSNDSGFANEPPPQPEVDYSDEEPTTQRVPIRRRADSNTQTVPRDVASWTLNRNFRNSVDSQIDDKSLQRLSRHSGGKMRYDLIASDDEILQASNAGLKRTKSFWKFGGGRSEDILAGMSLWQHRDLVAAPNLEELRLDNYNHKIASQIEPGRSDELMLSNEKSGTLTKSHNSNSSQEKRRKGSITSTENYGDEEENIYGVSPMQTQHQEQRSEQRQEQRSNSYTPKSRMKIMKTIEIDIEEPTDNERLSTIKRGQTTQHYQQQAYGRLDAHRKLEKRASANSTQQQQKLQTQTLMRNKLTSQQQQLQLQHQQQHHQQHQQHQQFPHSTDEGESDEHGTLKLSDVNNFFDEHNSLTGGNGGTAVMKTVKRKEILKQYYTSEDDESDAELKSTSSDPYDCIVINDHLVRKDDKLRRQHLQQQQQQQQQQQHLEFHTFRSTSTTATTSQSANPLKKTERSEKLDINNSGSSTTLTRNSTSNTLNSHNSVGAPTATILPRTRLLKTTSSSGVTSNSNTATLERHSHANAAKAKSYGPWYDFWDQQDEHQHHGISSSGPKATGAKMK